MREEVLKACFSTHVDETNDNLLYWFVPFPLLSHAKNMENDILIGFINGIIIPGALMGQCIRYE